MRDRVPDTRGGKHLLRERTASEGLGSEHVLEGLTQAFPGPSSHERKGLAFPISGETMGEDNPWFWLPFQLLLIDEVKIGSHHLQAPPLCRRRPACLSLWHHLGACFVSGSHRTPGSLAPGGSGGHAEEGCGKLCLLQTKYGVVAGLSPSARQVSQN